MSTRTRKPSKDLHVLFVVIVVFWGFSWLITQVGRKPSVRGQVVNILGFVDHAVSVSTIQLCRCRLKAAPDNKLISMAAF